MDDELRTSEDWQKICKITVLDPDGWDRVNYQYSWCKEKISREEFMNRVLPSTCMFNIEDFKAPWIDIGEDDERL